jgi:hypothetical protein
MITHSERMKLKFRDEEFRKKMLDAGFLPRFKEFCKRGHRLTKHGHGTQCQICLNILRNLRIAKQRLDPAYIERRRAYHRQWYKDHPEARASKKVTSEKNWKRLGIIKNDSTPFLLVDYDRHYQIQGGRCKICGKHQSELVRPLYVDHNHATGIFRGLLCQNCNAALGHAKESKEILFNLIKYMKESEVPDGNKADS